jgi:hypothetical protein
VFRSGFPKSVGLISNNIKGLSDEKGLNEDFDNYINEMLSSFFNEDSLDSRLNSDNLPRNDPSSDQATTTPPPDSLLRLITSYIMEIQER